MRQESLVKKWDATLDKNHRIITAAQQWQREKESERHIRSINYSQTTITEAASRRRRFLSLAQDFYCRHPLSSFPFSDDDVERKEWKKWEGFLPFGRRFNGIWKFASEIRKDRNFMTSHSISRVVPRPVAFMALSPKLPQSSKAERGKRATTISPSTYFCAAAEVNFAALRRRGGKFYLWNNFTDLRAAK